MKWEKGTLWRFKDGVGTLLHAGGHVVPTKNPLFGEMCMVLNRLCREPLLYILVEWSDAMLFECLTKFNLPTIGGIISSRKTNSSSF